jgi:hypothetical protein
VWIATVCPATLKMEYASNDPLMVKVSPLETDFEKLPIDTVAVAG